MGNERVGSSRQRYRAFERAYKQGLLDEVSMVRRKTTDRDAESRTADTPEMRLPARDQRRAYVRWYLRWLWPYRYATGLILILGLLSASIEMVEPLFMRLIVDRVLLDSAIAPAERLRLLHLAGAAFLIVIVISKLMGTAKDYWQRLLSVKLMVSLRRSLFERLLHLPLSKLHDMKTGGILSRLTGDVDTTTGLLQTAIVSPVIAIVRLIVAAAILLTLNWRLALTALAIIPGVILLSFMLARRIRPIFRSIRKDAELIDGRVGETFSGLRVVRAFRQEMLELTQYMRGRHTVLRKDMFAHRRQLALWLCWGLLLAGVNVVIVWYGGYLHLAGGASIGDIMAFQWYAFLLLTPAWSIVNSFSELQRSLAATERVFEILDMEVDKPDRPGARRAPNAVREIRFENVDFEYRHRLPVVRDFSVTVRGGSVVALVGRSGAGKTTLTDLVARFHDPTRGRILLNGSDIRDFTLASYRDLLGIVQQDVFLFDGSVRENIAYGRHHATRLEVARAAERAHAHEFIQNLPEQYETLIGERGFKLSGGQQQRLAIARAILADPQILIMDEATSNLDTESEQLIQASMAHLLAGRTTFVIAHRLSTIRRADLILLLDRGSVVESGTHDELMAIRGHYYAMVQRQIMADTGPIAGDSIPLSAGACAVAD
jgi:ATP-binding cassette, subfamily B, bacterial